MNWRRGFFRLWLILSIAWILVFAVVAGIIGGQGGVPFSILFYAAIGAPLFFLVCGFCISWALGGFRAIP